MKDVIIIGTGPAGMTAGIYAKRREMDVLVIGKEAGGQMMWASDIENYPGFASIKSFDLINKMQEHMNALGVETISNEVKSIIKNEDGTFGIATDKEVIDAKTLIIAMGLAPSRLAIPGEQEFQGRGVTYCATCDAPFYKGKTVVVVGGGNSALDAAEILSKIAAKVYLVHRRDEFKAFEGLVEEVRSKENVEMVLNCEIKKIIGTEKVEKIEVLNNQNNEVKEINVDGVFIEIGRIAHTDLVDGLVERNERNQIVVDGKCATSQPGIFAAGDVTDGEFKQITIACGQGTIAALSAYQYLQIKSGKSAGILLDRGKK